MNEQNQSVRPLQTHFHSALSCLAYLPELIFFFLFSFLPRSFAQVLQMYLPFCGISISNAKLFSESRKEYERSRVRGGSRTLSQQNRRRFWNVPSWSPQALLEVVNDLFEEQTDLEKIVRKIMQRALTLLQCERCSVLLLEDIDSPVRPPPLPHRLFLTFSNIRLLQLFR